MLFAGAEAIPQPNDLVKLWCHETMRVYKDKLADGKDIETFDKAQRDILKKTFDDIPEEKVITEPLIYCHFAKGIGEPKYMPITEWEYLHKLLADALKGYNELNAAMDLVLFEDAMSHICRINRILESPRGNALLIGVGGSGKQSLSRPSTKQPTAPPRLSCTNPAEPTTAMLTSSTTLNKKSPL